MTTAVIVAHPDDEVLGCGGAMAGWSDAGEHVHIAILGEGITSRYQERAAADRSQLDTLHHDAQAAAEVLGVRDVSLHGLPDNRFDTLPLLDVVKVVEELLDRLRPTAVYTHHPGDLNVDHLVTFRAVLTATRPMAGCPVRELYAFEVPSSTEWAFQRLEPPFRPNVFVDVSATIERKVAAMQAYTSEARPFPHPRSPEALRAIARRWGTVVGADFAEAFELVRAVR